MTFLLQVAPRFIEIAEPGYYLLSGIAFSVRQDSIYLKNWKKMMVLAMLPNAEQITCFSRHYARVAALPFPILSDDR